METLRKHFENDTRTNKIRLIKCTGQWIETGIKDYIIEKYGDRIYCGGYSTAYDECDIWVI